MANQNDKYAVLGCGLLIFSVIGIFTLSFLFIAGLSWLILDFCFEIYWSWNLAVGIYLLVLLFVWLFRKGRQ